MTATMILTGDVNLMNVTDPTVPFALVRDEFRQAAIVFSNLECCLYTPPGGHSLEREGFFADPAAAGEALVPRRDRRGRGRQQRQLRRGRDHGVDRPPRPARHRPCRRGC